MHRSHRQNTQFTFLSELYRNLATDHRRPCVRRRKMQQGKNCDFFAFSSDPCSKQTTCHFWPLVDATTGFLQYEHHHQKVIFADFPSDNDDVYKMGSAGPTSCTLHGSCSTESHDAHHMTKHGRIPIKLLGQHSVPLSSQPHHHKRLLFSSLLIAFSH